MEETQEVSVDITAEEVKETSEVSGVVPASDEISEKTAEEVEVKGEGEGKKEEKEEDFFSPPSRKKTVQDRIDELTRLRRQAERDAEYFKNLAMKDVPAPITESSSDRPRIENFETQESYEDALLTWHDRRKEQSLQTYRQQEKTKELVSTFNEKAAAIKREYEDFDDVVENLVFTPIMRETLLLSENGPQLAYFLGHPANKVIADRIARMSPIKQIHEIGKLEMKYLLTAKEKKVSSAPSPINPVGGISEGTKDPDKMTTAEWIAWDRTKEMEKLKKKLGG